MVDKIRKRYGDDGAYNNQYPTIAGYINSSYCKINKKSVLCIEGKDTLSFLQGLITNNIDKLKVNRVIYTTLLSPQCKLLHDFFLIKEKEKIYLDSLEKNITELKKKLNLYKLNRSVKIIEKKINSYFLFFGNI